MAPEEKELVLKDICSRLPYGVHVEISWEYSKTDVYTSLEYYEFPNIDSLLNIFWDEKCISIKPYLRPMSSMTEKERNDFENASHNWFYVNEDGEIYPMGRITDSGEFEDGILAGIEYLLKNHYDFRGLIPMGLSLEAPEGMYEFK